MAVALGIMVRVMASAAWEVQGRIPLAVSVRVTEPLKISAGLGVYVGVSVVAFVKVPDPLEVHCNVE